MEGQIAYKHKHRIGVFVDNQFSWLYEDNWKHKISYFMETLVSNSFAINKDLNLELCFNDFVYPSKDAFIRKIVVKNNAEYDRDVKLFFSQDFHIYGDKQQDTTFYEPNSKAIVHYRKKRYFLIGGVSDHVGIDSYSTGKSEYNGLEGTWRDAEDGRLEKNPIDQGSVDSTVEFDLNVKANSEKTLYVWICAGKKINEVQDIQAYILKENPEKLMRNTINYWLSWVNKNSRTDYGLNLAKVQEQLKQSLLIMRTQVDNRGAIIAANDSDIMKFNKDTYTYMWPRDGAWVALAFDRA